MVRSLHQVYLVGSVQFTLPARDRVKRDKWTIRSHDGALQLQFTPHAAREEHVHVGLIASGKCLSPPHDHANVQAELTR
jgi:hypothetical protein